MCGNRTAKSVDMHCEADWGLMLEVTLKNVLLMSEYIVLNMKRVGGFKIVNIGSG
jgi:hypothetical protein